MNEGKQSNDTDEAANRVAVSGMGYAPRERVEKYLNELSGERCWRCKFFDPDEGVTEEVCTVDDFSLGIRQSLEGYCRRYPPTSTFNQETEEVESSWAWVVASDWCGEFVQCNRSINDLTGDSSR
jgi:hypothetical protein